MAIILSFFDIGIVPHIQQNHNDISCSLDFSFLCSIGNIDGFFGAVFRFCLLIIEKFDCIISLVNISLLYGIWFHFLQ